MKKVLLPLIFLVAFASVVLLATNSINSKARIIRPQAAQGNSGRVIRSSASGIKVEEVRQVTLNGHPFVEVTLRNVSNLPATYLHIQHGDSFTEVSFLVGEYLAPQATTVQQFDAHAKTEVVVAAAVYANGSAEGELLPVKKAAFYHDQFLAAVNRYLATTAATRAERRPETEVTARLLAQAAQEPEEKEYRTTGGLAASRFITRTLNAQDGRGQAEKLNNLLLHLQRVQSNTRSTKGGGR